MIYIIKRGKERMLVLILGLMLSKFIVYFLKKENKIECFVLLVKLEKVKNYLFILFVVLVGYGKMILMVEW